MMHACYACAACAYVHMEIEIAPGTCMYVYMIDVAYACMYVGARRACMHAAVLLHVVNVAIDAHACTYYYACCV